MLGVCRNCSKEHEPKEWLRVDGMLWARCPRCLTLVEVGRVSGSVGGAEGTTDSEPDTGLIARSRAAPALNRVLSGKLAEILGTFELRLTRAVMPQGSTGADSLLLPPETVVSRLQLTAAIVVAFMVGVAITR